MRQQPILYAIASQHCAHGAGVDCHPTSAAWHTQSGRSHKRTNAQHWAQLPPSHGRTCTRCWHFSVDIFFIFLGDKEFSDILASTRNAQRGTCDICKVFFSVLPSLLCMQQKKNANVNVVTQSCALCAYVGPSTSLHYRCFGTKNRRFLTHAKAGLSCMYNGVGYSLYTECLAVRMNECLLL